MEEAHMGIAVPFVGLLLILGTLLLFGIAWMFHHHFWKPVVGGLLFVVGLAVLVMFGWVASPHHMVQEAYAPRSVERYPRDNLRGISTAPAPPGSARTDTSSSPGTLEARADVELRVPDDVPEVTPTPGSASTTDAGSSTPSRRSQPAAADSRPDWVDRAPGLKSAGASVEATVASGLYATRAECDRAIIPRVKELADEYVTENFPDAVDNDLSLDRSYIWSKLVKAKYWETVDKSFGGETHAMNQLHVLLAFDNQVGRDLAEQARQSLIGTRLQEAAGIVACSLAVLGGAYMLLKRGAPPRTPTPEQVAS